VQVGAGAGPEGIAEPAEPVEQRGQPAFAHAARSPSKSAASRACGQIVEQFHAQR
jgi:hypothetical protein